MESKKEYSTKWSFIDKVGSFEWENPHAINQLYFPICNEAGMMSSVTPRLGGDAKTGQNTFLLLPVSVEDLQNNRSSRNFWIYNDEFGAYSLTGNSAKQIATQFSKDDNVNMTISGTFLAHSITREDPSIGVKSEIISFCPVTEDAVEIILVSISNISSRAIHIMPTTAIPLFGRSAENIRDHKHATSLMHRMELSEYGMSITPTMHHDEGGHRPNNTTYFVLAVGGNGEKPIGQFPTVAEFIGEYGSYDWPMAVVKNILPYKEAPNRRDGMEAIGAIRFNKTELLPGEKVEYVVVAGVTEDKATIERAIGRYGSSEKARTAYEKNLEFWKEKAERISFKTEDSDFDRWMRWVGIQPILRKIYGCSFLPHHDYGKGGRGWRDLWQDCLALLLQNPGEVRNILISNFAGVRLDGSNATIINKGLGNFSADRNKVSRVWMDHGVWPWYTTKLYIEQTGDIDILFEENTYWKDHQIKRAKAKDVNWVAAHGNAKKVSNGGIYTGSLIEHMIVQQLTCFHNVGDYNNMKLEDADWNDQLDMAPIKGESVPFTAFYGWNLITISEMLVNYKVLKKVESIRLFKELLLLININEGSLDYDKPEQKRVRLEKYFDAVEGNFSGEKVDLKIDELARALREKGEWVLRHVCKDEWIDSKTGHGFFNGYYNNDGHRVDGDHEDGTRMNLTAQTFAIMSGAATDKQVLKTYEAVKEILKDPITGGYRLTTPLGRNNWNFGRGFALIYGEKETGGMFSHMAVMFTNALYRRGFVKEGYESLTTIYKLCRDTEKAKIYPGIPEYISHEGRGMYHYLTGSASWLLMTILTEVFGVRGELGKLVLEPKLVKEQFDNEGKAGTTTFFRNKRIEVEYVNEKRACYGDYRVARIEINGSEAAFKYEGKKAVIEVETFNLLAFKEENKINVILS